MELPKRRDSPPGCTPSDFVAQHCTTPCAQNPPNVPGHLNKPGFSARRRIILSQGSWGGAPMPCASSVCCVAFLACRCPVKPKRGRQRKIGSWAANPTHKSPGCWGGRVSQSLRGAGRRALLSNSPSDDLGRLQKKSCWARDLMLRLL